MLSRDFQTIYHGSQTLATDTHDFGRTRHITGGSSQRFFDHLPQDLASNLFNVVAIDDDQSRFLIGIKGRVDLIDQKIKRYRLVQNCIGPAL